MLIDFTDKTVIVTGAGRGIGREIALSFAARGATVWACDVLTAELEETRLAAADGTVVARSFDITRRRAVQDFVDEAGAVDIVVHSAGGVCGQLAKPLGEVSEAEWDSVLDVNVKGLFFMAQAVTPGMKQRGGGRIVAVTSVASVRVALSGVQAYAAAKHAEVGLIRQLAFEFGPFGITVNGVGPGFIRTTELIAQQWDNMGPAGQAAVMQSFALRRMGSAADVAHAVMFLASDYAGWITGQNLLVDGGSGPALSAPARAVADK